MPIYCPGKPINGFAIGEVIRTEAATHPLGSLLYGFGTFEEYSIITKDQLKNWRIVDNSVGLPYTTLVGGAGMSGSKRPTAQAPCEVNCEVLTLRLSWVGDFRPDRFLGLPRDWKAAEGRDDLWSVVSLLRASAAAD